MGAKHLKLATKLFVAASAAALLAGPVSGAAGPAVQGDVQAAPQANPQVKVRNNFGQDASALGEDMRIDRFDLDVDIVGGTARTVATVKFSNPTGRQTEGDFTLDLPDRSVITGYGLDVNGAMVDGVVVSKRQGTQAYENRIRQGVDPGLASTTRTGDFTTRVFPVGPQGRTIKLEFVTPLGKDGAYVMPLSQADIGELDITIRALGMTGAPVIKAPSGVSLDWQETARGLEAHAVQRRAKLSGALSVSIADARLEPITLSRHRTGEVFFEINDPTAAAGAAPAPRRLRVYWDTSRSRKDDATDREIELVRAFIAKHPNLAVDLVQFSDDGPHVESFAAGRGEGAGASLQKVRYSGATSMARLFDAAAPRADVCLMFTDGDVTMDDFSAVRAGCQLYTVSSEEGARRDVLASLAARSGGEHIDLTQMSNEAALARLANPAPRVVRVLDADREEVDYVSLQTPTGVRIIGRAPSRGDLLVEIANGRTESRTYALDRGRVRSHDGLGALWAHAMLAELTAAARPDEKAVLAHARRYGVAGEGLVYVVLETPMDYVNNEIEPPASLGKPMLASYQQLVENRRRQKENERSFRLTRIANAWNEQKQWWENRPPKDAGVRPMDRADARREGFVAAAPSRIAPMPAPPMAVAAPPPPPPPPVLQPREVPPPAASLPQTEVNEIVVTGTRIRGTAQSSALPVEVIAGADLSQRQSARAAVDGAAAANLGNFSSGRTLTTLDGRRLADGPASGAEADVQIQREAAPARRPQITAQVEPWTANRAYIEAIARAPDARFWEVYHAQEDRFGNTPAFYFDVAAWLHRKGRTRDAAQVVMNVVELKNANTTTFSILADRLMTYGDHARAIWLYEQILFLEPDRPQPRRNLALALIDRAELPGASDAERRADYRRALDLLTEVVMTPWNSDYDGVEMISLMEANRVIPRLRRLGVDSFALDSRLIALLDVDLRVVLEWNTDKTDMDLWVTEPNGETAAYNHPRTSSGGRMSNDMTAGYGPEEYLLRRAPNGRYEVSVDVYASDRFNPNGASTVRARLYHAYGRPEERVEVMEIDLEPQDDDTRVIGSFRVGNSRAER